MARASPTVKEEEKHLGFSRQIVDPGSLMVDRMSTIQSPLFEEPEWFAPNLQPTVAATDEQPALRKSKRPLGINNPPKSFSTPPKRLARDAYSFSVDDPDAEWTTLPSRKKIKQKFFQISSLIFVYL